MRFNHVITGAMIVAVGSIAAAPVRAEEARTNFSIEAMSLNDALKSYALQCGDQVLLSDDIGGVVRSQGVSGFMTRDDALQHILKGTGFRAIRSRSGVVSLQKAKSARLLPVASAAVSAAQAQDLPGPVETKPAKAPLPSEIIVTAQKKSQRLQDVPTAISVVSGQQLENAGITNVGDLTRAVPGLVFNRNGAFAQPTIRGIGTRSTSAGDSPSVALYVDGVYMSAQQGGFTDFNNVERVEVLKGPQGTLFGRNATGGAINVVTRTPSHSTGLDASIGVEEYGRITAKGYVTAGLSDTIAADFAAFFDRNDGFVRDRLSGERLRDMDNWGIRSKWLWEPSDSLTFTLSGDYSSYSSNQALGYSAIDRNVASLRLEPDDAVTGEKRGEVALSFVPSVDAEQWGVGLTSVLEGESLSLTSITAYREVVGRALADLDATNLPRVRYELRAPTNTITQELYLNAAPNDAIEVTAGLFLLDEHAQRDPNKTIAISSSGTTTTNVTVVDSWTQAFAPYGEITVHLTDRLSAIVGARYSYEHRKLRNYRNDVPRAAASASFRNTDYRASLRFEPTDQIMLYGTVSTGFKSGVFNTSAFDGNPVDPEKVDAYEIGFKSNFGPVTLNADAFYYDYKDIQVTIGLDPNTGQTGLQNAASAKIKGGEIEGNIRLAGGLSGRFGVSYVHGRYEDFSFAQVLVPIPGGGNSNTTFDASGFPLMRSPDWTLTGGIDYSTDLFGGTLDLGGSVYHSSSFSWEPSARIVQDPYTLLRASVGWTSPDDRYTITVYGDNLTDEVYWENATINTTGDLVTYGMPRRFGARLSVSL